MNEKELREATISDERLEYLDEQDIWIPVFITHISEGSERTTMFTLSTGQIISEEEAKQRLRKLL